MRDSSGASVPNAKVIATNNQTKDASEATSNTDGLYVLPALRPGTYTLTVEAAGFSKTSIRDIELVVSANVAQDVMLELGKLSEVIEVKANAVAVATTDAQVAAAVTMRDIDTLPQLARTPITLGIFQPGVQISQNGSSAGTDTSYSHVNGLRQGSNNTTLDGIDVNDAVAPRYGLSMTANNTDSVEEFRVVTEGGKAEYGRNAGGQIEMISRSGTNEYHFSLLEYMRNQALNANDFFNNSPTSPRRCSSRTSSAALSADHQAQQAVHLRQLPGPPHSSGHLPQPHSAHRPRQAGNLPVERRQRRYPAVQRAQCRSAPPRHRSRHRKPLEELPFTQQH